MSRLRTALCVCVGTGALIVSKYLLFPPGFVCVCMRLQRDRYYGCKLCLIPRLIARKTVPEGTRGLV